MLDTVISNSSFLPSQPNEAGTSSPKRPFVYISAADGFRPVVPARYIETKRQAESEILRRCLAHPDANLRPVFMRPGESWRDPGGRG